MCCRLCATSSAGPNPTSFTAAAASCSPARTCPANQFATRFYSNTMLVILLLLAAHVGCFVASVVMLDKQKQYIDEVDDAGVACIAMHRLAIDCRCELQQCIMQLVIEAAPRSPPAHVLHHPSGTASGSSGTNTAAASAVHTNSGPQNGSTVPCHADRSQLS